MGLCTDTRGSSVVAIHVVKLTAPPSEHGVRERKMKPDVDSEGRTATEFYEVVSLEALLEEGLDIEQDEDGVNHLVSTEEEEDD